MTFYLAIDKTLTKFTPFAVFAISSVDVNFKTVSEAGLYENLSKVCLMLNKHSVEYLVVGGTAVAIHGFYRLSMTVEGIPEEKHDFDFWYNPTYPNYYKLLDALEELGQDMSEWRAEQTPNPKKSFFKIDWANFRTDFLPEINGLSKFSDSYKKRSIETFGGTNADIICYQDLIDSKKASGRKKDIDDIENLNSKN